MRVSVLDDTVGRCKGRRQCPAAILCTDLSVPLCKLTARATALAHSQRRAGERRVPRQRQAGRVGARGDWVRGGGGRTVSTWCKAGAEPGAHSVSQIYLDKFICWDMRNRNKKRV